MSLADNIICSKVLLSLQDMKHPSEAVALKTQLDLLVTCTSSIISEVLLHGKIVLEAKTLFSSQNSLD